jgi:hypothetical protein
VCRLFRILFIVAVVFAAAAPSAGATPAKTLDAQLGALCTAVLHTSSAENSFGTGGEAFGCWSLDGTVAPFGPTGVSSCAVKPGTRILVAASSVECSTFEDNGSTDAELRTCAREGDVQLAPSVTVDGQAVQVREVETALLAMVLPADNLFGLPAGAVGLSVAHGWVALLNPLTPGSHEIVITIGSQTLGSSGVDGCSAESYRGPDGAGVGGAGTCTATGNGAHTAVTVVPSAHPRLHPSPGASLSSPPLLRWTRVTKARYYNVQLYREDTGGAPDAAQPPPGSEKILSQWPTKPRFHLRRSWRYGGQRRRLSPGHYRWYVWAGYGPRSKQRYSGQIVNSTFTVTR